MDEGRTEEIAVDRLPDAAVAPLAAVLVERDQPFALAGPIVRQQGGIGRPQSLDDTDAAQNSDSAAFLVSWPSGPISK